jgi:hypothetical protein
VGDYSAGVRSPELESQAGDLPARKKTGYLYHPQRDERT